MTQTKEIVIEYEPQPKQELLHRCAGNEILFGGAAGPGKSLALRMEALIWGLRVPGIQIYLFRRTFPELEKNHILPVIESFPDEVGVYKSQARRFHFTNGSILHFCHAQYETDVLPYQGAEIHLLLIDELTTFTEFQYDYLRARVRCTLPVPEKYRHKVPGIITASNPGGVGHTFVKTRWVRFAEPFELKRAPKKEGGMLRCFLPGLLDDNAILMKLDPGYIDRLDALPEPYRTAYKDGDWDIFLGQMFDFQEKYHVINPHPVPKTAPIYMSFDWGFGKPFSCGWWYTDSDGRLIRFYEWYGAIPGMPDQGIRMADEDIAQGILSRERKLCITDRDIIRYCDPTCFNKKPDTRGGGQGPSTAEEMAAVGVFFEPGDPSRILKVRQFHGRLKRPTDHRSKEERDRHPGFDDRPMMQVFKGCVDFIRTVPALQADLHNAEDVDTNSEDHCYDEACLVLMSRPIALEEPVAKPPKTQIILDRAMQGLDPFGADKPLRDPLQEVFHG